MRRRAAAARAPLHAVAHCPAVFGIARIGDRVSRLQQTFPELHDPRRDVHRRDVRQRQRGLRIHEAVGVDGQAAIPVVGEEQSVLRSVLDADHFVKGRRMRGEGGAEAGGEDQRQYRYQEPQLLHVCSPLAQNGEGAIVAGGAMRRLLSLGSSPGVRGQRHAVGDADPGGKMLERCAWTSINPRKGI